ncbi:MAG: DNA repair protein RecO [Deltaproteobacteria bacterium]|jgi:DNA repair protein RecO (recombination protein O)|nr:DNA repair protein RecO [Deltaproteobacteria bacterium]MBW2531865.1 DNA repair protein RecO [Deltaproteobacteria bacterium]
MARHRVAKRRVRSGALLLRRVPYGESDLIVTLFTEQEGAVSAAARGALRSKRRFAGLESMHLLRVEVDLAPQRDIATLVEVRVDRPRVHLLGSLSRLDAAGQALRWLRRAAPARTPEPQLWLEVNALLDALDSPATALSPGALLGAGGLRILEATGWGLDLSRCVRCDEPCPDRAKVTVDVVAGGVVCRRCGGGAVTLSAERRARLLAALDGDERSLEDPADADVAIELVSGALAAHGQSESS